MDIIENENLEKPEPTPHEKFLEEASVLTNKASAAIKKVDKLANVRNYEYSEEEVLKLKEYLLATIEKTFQKFEKDEEFSWNKN